MSSNHQLEDNNNMSNEAPISVEVPQVPIQNERQSGENDEFNKRQNVDNALPFFDPGRRSFIGRSSGIPLTRRKSLFDEFTEANDVQKFASAMSWNQLRPHIEHSLNNCSTIQREDHREMTKVLKSIWRAKEHKNIKLSEDPKFLSVFINLLKSVHYHGDNLFLMENEKFEKRVSKMRQMLDNASEEEFCNVVDMLSSDDAAETEAETILNFTGYPIQVPTDDDGPPPYIWDRFTESDLPAGNSTSLFDIYRAGESAVKRYAQKILWLDFERTLKEVFSIEDDPEGYDMLIRLVKLTWEESSIAEEDLMESHEILAFVSAFFKSIFHDEGKRFVFSHPVYFHLCKKMITAIENHEDLDTVFRTTHFDFVQSRKKNRKAPSPSNPPTPDSRLSSSEAMEEEESNSDEDSLDTALGITDLVVVNDHRETSQSTERHISQSTVPVTQNDAATVGTTPRPVIPPTQIAHEGQSNQQEGSHRTSTPLLPQSRSALEEHFAELDPLKPAKLRACRGLVSVGKILEGQDGPSCRLVSSIANSHFSTPIISNALLIAKFNPREQIRAMQLITNLLDGKDLGVIEDVRTRAVIHAFRKCTVHCNGRSFLLMGNKFKKEYFKYLRLSNINSSENDQ